MTVAKTDTLIIGGGAIGLAIAYELSRRGRSVVLLERDKVGKQASWAGAGIFPPFNQATAIHPLEKLEAISSELHEVWAVELQKQTGIDVGFRRCGGLYLARTVGEVAALTGELLYWSERQIEYEELSPARLARLAPGLMTDQIDKSVFVPSEYRFRNPRFVKALLAVCQQNGVQIVEDCGATEIVVVNHQTDRIVAGDQEWVADNYCVTCGAWSEQLLQPFEVPLPSIPVRGQVVLFKLDEPLFQPVINEGTRYFVPRDDGYVLAGSTIEEVGFDSSVVPSDIEELKSWACGLVPDLNENSFQKSWAGLRPATYDGFPYLGPVGRSGNTFVATGHFKSGLHLSTGTAIMMADLLTGNEPPIDLTPFAPSRAEYHVFCSPSWLANLTPEDPTSSK